jgi:uncharacterized OB-fold protein
MTKYVTFKSVCSVCGEVYASKEVEMVFTDSNDPRLRVLKKDGHIKSHGYCPLCFKTAQQEMRLVARKVVDTYA